MQNLDVKHINPFLQSSISIIQSTTQIELKVGKPVISELVFDNETFILQIASEYQHIHIIKKVAYATFFKIFYISF